MTAYYNENDSQIAAWLRELIRRDIIAPGEVDERSITDVRPDDLRGYGQCHFFAGAGGWSYALRLARVPDDYPVWTGSCPCQPFSAAGRRAGEKDARHLWPEFYRLIEARRPGLVFGEQVASADVVGRQLEAAFATAFLGADYARANKLAKRILSTKGFTGERCWIDSVYADLAGIGYAFGFKILGAHSAGSAHRRQRVFWVADSRSERDRRRPSQTRSASFNGKGEKSEFAGAAQEAGNSRAACRVANSDNARPQRQPGAGDGIDEPGRISQAPSGFDSATGGLGDAESIRRNGRPDDENSGRRERASERAGAGNRLGDTEAVRRDERRPSDKSAGAAEKPGRSVATGNPWADVDWLECQDGKIRPIEPGLEPLVNGVSARVLRLRGYGNAIVPQTAARFVREYLDGVTHDGMPSGGMSDGKL
jgi:DNA (cytosine-5)-methyltransferase 1